MNIVMFIGLAVLGMILGSFANALVWRIHEQEEIRDKLDELHAKKPTAQRDAKIADYKRQLNSLSMSRGRSMCSECSHPLAAADLVPLFSWLYLRGKCRYCRKPIKDTPWLEFGLPLAFLLSFLLWPYSISNPFGLLAVEAFGTVSFIFWLIFLVGFAALTVYDIRWYILPDRIVWPLVSLAAVQVLLHATLFKGGLEVITEALWGVAVASGIFYVLYRVSKGEWIGGGDVKLGIVLGLLVGGPLPALLVLFIASLLGTLASLPMLVTKKLHRNSVVPFGPFLIAGAVVVTLFGSRLLAVFERLVIGV